MADRDKAINLINAYFDGEDIVMYDPIHGVDKWTSAVNNPEYWSYLEVFCRNVDRYRIVKDCPPRKKKSSLFRQLTKLTTMSKNLKNLIKFLIAAIATGTLLYCVSQTPMKPQHITGAVISLIIWAWYFIQVIKGEEDSKENKEG